MEISVRHIISQVYSTLSFFVIHVSTSMTVISTSKTEHGREEMVINVHYP